MSGEVDSFNAYCSALIAVAMRKMWCTFINNFWSYSKKNIDLFFVDTVYNHIVTPPRELINKLRLYRKVRARRIMPIVSQI